MYHRIFAATLAIAEQNAYQAITQYRPEFRTLSRDQWRKKLGELLVTFDDPIASKSPSSTLQHGIMHKLATEKRCSWCKDPSDKGEARKCKYACACGEVVCSPLTDRDWFAKHLKSASRTEMGLSPLKRRKM